MNKLFSILFAGILCCSGLAASAYPVTENVSTEKETNTVRIYQVYNPTENISDANENSNLRILYARGDKMPQYLIMLDESVKQEENCLSARFLINQHSTLAFLQGKLYNDSLLIITHDEKEKQIDIKTVDKNGEGEYCPVLFSFRLTDNSEEQNFLIESWAKNIGSIEGEWIKINNGKPVAVSTTLAEAIAGKADIFNFGKITKTNHEEGSKQELAESKVSVMGEYGAVLIQGAIGKKIVIRNSHGQVIANETARSNSVTIPAPTGIALVSIDNQQALKALVK